MFVPYSTQLTAHCASCTTWCFCKPQRRDRSLAPEATTARRHRRRLTVFCHTRAHAEKPSFLKSRSTRAESFYEAAAAAAYALAWHVICTSDFSAERFYCLTARRTRIYDTTTYPVLAPCTALRDIRRAPSLARVIVVVKTMKTRRILL